MNKARLFVIVLFLSAVVVGCAGPIAPVAESDTIEAVDPPAGPTLTHTTIPPTTTKVPPTTTSLPPTATTEPTVVVTPTETPDTAPDAPATQDEATPTAAETTTAEDANCINRGAFFADVTIPDYTPFDPGETFTKIWRVRNEGDCTWTNYKLVFANGNMMEAAPSHPVDDTGPGEVVDISVDMVAPSESGTHYGNWEFETDSGERFGFGTTAAGYIWVQIGIRQPVATAPVTGGTAGGTTPAPAPTTEAAGTTESVGSCSANRNISYENTTLELINAERTAQGAGRLEMVPELQAAALAHSIDMACNDFVDHTGSDGSGWSDRVRAQGYSFSKIAENIYVGNPAFGGTPQGAFDWWMNSQIHRTNMLNSDFNKVGLAYVLYENSTYGGYYTLVLVRK